MTAANTLMGPFMVIITGSGLIILPEATRIWRDRPHRLLTYCVLISGGFMRARPAWGVVLLVALPRGLGHLLLGPVWKPTYPLVLPTALAIMGFCGRSGPGIGLHALAAASRSLRAAVIISVYFRGVLAGWRGPGRGDRGDTRHRPGHLAGRGRVLVAVSGRAAGIGRLAHGHRSWLGRPPRQQGKHRGERRRS